MNTQLKQRIDETVAQLTEQRQAEVLDFAEFLRARDQAAAQRKMDEGVALMREIIQSPPKARLSALKLDLTGFKFNRDEANER
ncbi:MAG: DUF2281 domain-containing protein [Rhodoferax sp.]|nr:DUF2281 domain-containing protein [Rhodoferax sp.]